ncbi:MAG: Nitrogen regulatory protein [Chlamydiae bacterium]|nr:Nitrogen regulatory protein [Chlamydiota bacterium]
MDLKIKDVAELLSVSETTIRRWLLDGKIPAYKLNRQYRFSKIEIENWMMEQRLNPLAAKTSFPPVAEPVQIYPRGEEPPARSGMQQFSLYRAINRGGVLVDVAGETKEEIIRNVMGEISATLRMDRDVLSELLLDREKMMPTAFNNGIAVPHARECLQHVPFDLITVAFPQKPIEYGALDKKPVEALFFLFATGDKIHLHLLAKLAHLSSNEKALNFLSTKPTKSSLLEFIREWETTL